MKNIVNFFELLKAIFISICIYFFFALSIFQFYKVAILAFGTAGFRYIGF